MAIKIRAKIKTTAPTRPDFPAGQAIAKIREFHELGVRVLKLVAEDKGTIQSISKLLNETDGIPFNKVKTAAQFAALCRKNEGYLAGICELCFAPDSKHLLSVNHVQKVLGFKETGELLVWLTRAAKEGWSARDLELRTERPSSDRAGMGGRPIKRQGNLLGDLEKVISQSDAWTVRFCKLWRDDKPKTGGIGRDDHDRAALAAKLLLARDSLDRLVDAAKRLGQRLENIEADVKPVSARTGTQRGSAKGTRQHG